jgi:hypothetical protein
LLLKEHSAADNGSEDGEAHESGYVGSGESGEGEEFEGHEADLEDAAEVEEFCFSEEGLASGG